MPSKLVSGGKGQGNHGDISNAANKRAYSSSQKPSLYSLTDSDFFECTDLVVWGENLPSSVGNSTLTKIEREMIKISPYQYSVIIGLLLSDGWLSFSNLRSKNPRLGFKQKLSNSEYVWFVFNLLSHYCGSYPNLSSGGKIGNKRHLSLGFFTRSLQPFNELILLFYPNKVKIIPKNIFELLTPVALAHWIMGDGSAFNSGGLALYTDSYSIEDVVLLINVLIIRYGLKCSIHTHREGQYRIYISKNSLYTLKQIVKPYIIPSMHYKIKL